MSPIRVLSTDVHWSPWTSGAFDRARTERKPVLLFISAAWCRSCREMDRTSYADPTIASLINERFVPIRVDADERPDIGERYGLGGWPTTAFLTHDGAILGGGTYVPIERMPGVLEQVMAAFGTGGERLTGRRQAPPSAPAAGGAVPSAEDLCASVFETFDGEYGGFGREPKFPLAAPITLALDLWQETHDPDFETIVVKTLDAMGWGGLYDEVDGGFFHYAGARDWQSPHTEKLLDVNAALLRLYLDAGTRLDVARFLERAADVLRYVQTWLADLQDGGWAASQAADDRYYASEVREGRRELPPPDVAHAQYSDANAAMASAVLHAARSFDDEGLGAFALRSLERVLLAAYRPGAGAAHFVVGQPRVRGLLADQMAMAAAQLDAFDATGNIVYQMMAEELAHYAVRVLWDEQHGGFFDRAADQAPIGLMRLRLKPFVTNCDAARTLRRLAVTSGDAQFAAFADRTLEAMAPHALEQGPLAAHYVLAVRDAGVR